MVAKRRFGGDNMEENGNIGIGVGRLRRENHSTMTKEEAKEKKNLYAHSVDLLLPDKPA